MMLCVKICSFAAEGAVAAVSEALPGVVLRVYFKKGTSTRSLAVPER
jgi:hypothetical protein